MGQMAELNLAATRQENVELRAELQRLHMIIEGMRAVDRMNVLRAQFVAAELSDPNIGEEAAIEGGFKAADLFVERLKAEAKDADGDNSGDAPVVPAQEAGKLDGD